MVSRVVGNPTSVLVGRETAGRVYCSSHPRTIEEAPSEPSVFTVTSHTTSAPKPSLASGTWPLFLGVLFMMIGNGLQISLIGVRSTLEAFPTTVTGVIIAAYYVGFLVGSFQVPRVLKSVGHIRVFAALASLASAAVLANGLFVNPPVWIVMRGVTGLAMAGLYITSESWLNARATNATRGRLLATYMIMSMGGISIGQALLGLGDPLKVDLFVMASIAVSLALVPLTLTNVEAPDLGISRSIKFATLWKLAPLGIVTGFLTGVANGAFSGMITVYATLEGFAIAKIGLFAAASVIGGIVFQLPIGHLSDAVPRRRVIFGCALTGVILMSVAATLTPGSGLMYLCVFLFGGILYPMYSLSISHINDVLDREQMLGAAAAFMFVFGLGAVIGPIVTAIVMDRFGPTGFFLTNALYYLPVAVYALWRIFTRTVPNRTAPVSGYGRVTVGSWTPFLRKRPTGNDS